MALTSHVLETRDIQAQAQAQCQAGGVPALSFRLLTTPNMANLPVTMAWSPIDGDGNPVAGAPEANLPDTITPGQIYNLTWPGVVLSDLGALIGLPGFRPQALSDFDADGNLLPGLAQWNGLVLDTTTATYPWRNNSRLTFSVNPEVSLELAYPDTEESPCAAAEAAGETSVEIEKTASAGNLKPGESFEYTLDVTNTHETGAADDVVVTDEIPASIKVNSIDKGSQTALPRWETCEITGKDARGFGGTLTCTLQGVVQPQSQASGSTAPPITLAVTLDNKATAEVTNTGVVNYCAAENAEACGTDEDDAFVVVDDLGGVDESDDDGGDTGGESGDVDGLPSTGSSVDPRTLGLAGLLIALGMSMLVGSRRRRES